MKYFFITIIISLVNYSAINGQIHLTVKLNKNIEVSKIRFFYIDGVINKFISPKFINNTALIKDSLRSKYARLIIMYPDKYNIMPGLCLLINNTKSSIEFYEVDDSVSNKLTNYNINNLINVENASIYKKINRFTENELKNFNRLNKEINNSSSDSIQKLKENSYELLALKEIEYIKTHGNNYFYFEKFISEIVPSLKSKYLVELYEIFNTSFPGKFKVSYEGKATKTLLEGNLYVKLGMKCPQFKGYDYLGNEISTENLKGKFYILSFWATWCSPCIKEIPLLKSISDKYEKTELQIISITRDTDSTKFIDGISKNKMNWTHVFNSPTMENLFGQKPIPSIYLIDKNGSILFSSWEKNFVELNTILRRELEN